jgi:hypothetical protein
LAANRNTIFPISRRSSSGCFSTNLPNASTAAASPACAGTGRDRRNAGIVHWLFLQQEVSLLFDKSSAEINRNHKARPIPQQLASASRLQERVEFQRR